MNLNGVTAWVTKASVAQIQLHDTEIYFNITMKRSHSGEETVWADDLGWNWKIETKKEILQIENQ